MKRSPLRRVGKKTREWDKARAELKVKCIREGRTHCELRYPGCWGEAHGFCHSLKRRNITSPELLREAILGCNSCHQRLELLPESEMARIVREILSCQSAATR